MRSRADTDEMTRDHRADLSPGPHARPSTRNFGPGRRSWFAMRWPSPRSLLVGPALALAACAHPAATTAPSQPPTAWIDAPLLGSPPAEVEQLEAFEGGDLTARRARLDRLLDLYDAARFGEDEDARETLWGALGGHATGVGEHASRDALQRMLQDALGLEEDARPRGDQDTAGFAADVIMMVSTDLQTPATAEDLSIRTLVYRTLAESGHPRLRDNARWRLYDHVRGTLAGATEMAPEQRLEVAVQALYAERDSVEPLLADTAPHARPPWPSVEQLWGVLEQQREPLLEEARWAEVMGRRRGDDEVLHDTLRTTLPAPREDDWPLRSVPAGTGRVESLAPVVRVAAGRMTVDAGRSHARTVVLSDEDVLEPSRTLGNALAQDGRGTVLLVADPSLPAPELRTALRVVARAHTERVELAVREPRVAPAEGEVVTALPLYVTSAGGQRAGDQAWAVARVHVHLDGRGPQVAVDGRWLSARPSSQRNLRTLVEEIARAYPRERGVVVSLGPDVQLQQLLDLSIALQGGPQRPFAAVGWMADGSRPGASKDDGDGWLERRLEMAWVKPAVELEQAYPLKADDQKRLEAFTEDVAVCLPELRVKGKSVPEAVALELRFEEGRLRGAEVKAPTRLAKGGGAAVVECVEQEAYALRLREHREGITVGVTLRRAAGS